MCPSCLSRAPEEQDKPRRRNGGTAELELTKTDVVEKMFSFNAPNLRKVPPEKIN